MEEVKRNCYTQVRLLKNFLTEVLIVLQNATTNTTVSLLRKTCCFLSVINSIFFHVFFMPLVALAAFIQTGCGASTELIYYQPEELNCPTEEEGCKGEKCSFLNIIYITGEKNKRDEITKIEDIQVRWTKNAGGRCQADRSGGKGSIALTFTDGKKCTIGNTVTKCEGFEWRTPDDKWKEPTPGEPVTDPPGFRVKKGLTYIRIEYKLDLKCICGRETNQKNWQTELEVRLDDRVRGNPLPIPAAKDDKKIPPRFPDKE